MRDRLVELLMDNSCHNRECPDVPCDKCKNIALFTDDAERIADLILADGWVRPPIEEFCKQPTEKVCTGKRCPMQVGYDVKNCKDKDCFYRTETEKGGCRVMDYIEYARQLRENAVKDDNGVIRCSPELWEQIATIIENINTTPKLIELLKEGGEG